MPMTTWMSAGWRVSHATAIAVGVTPYFSANRSSSAFSSGYSFAPKNTPPAVLQRLEKDIAEAVTAADCKEKLADFKRPKQIHITTAIPRTATGKIQRRIVAEAFAGQAT